jgi:SnoaL-like domain
MLGLADSRNRRAGRGFCRGHDGAVDEIARRAHAAMTDGDWEQLRLLLHPYVRWTDNDGSTVRGRNTVMAMLERAGTAPAPPSSAELRDGQIYRWRT